MNHHHHHHHVEGQIVTPAHVTIGIKREGLDHFNDLQELEKHPAPYRIHKVKGLSFLIYKSNTTRIISWVYDSPIWPPTVTAWMVMTSPSSSLLDHSSDMFMKKLLRFIMMMIFQKSMEELELESMKSVSEHTEDMPRLMDTPTEKCSLTSSLEPLLEQHLEDTENILISQRLESTPCWLKELPLL